MKKLKNIRIKMIEDFFLLKKNKNWLKCKNKFKSKKMLKDKKDNSLD